MAGGRLRTANIIGGRTHPYKTNTLELGQICRKLSNGSVGKKAAVGNINIAKATTFVCKLGNGVIGNVVQAAKMQEVKVAPEFADGMNRRVGQERALRQYDIAQSGGVRHEANDSWVSQLAAGG